MKNAKLLLLMIHQIYHLGANYFPIISCLEFKYLKFYYELELVIN